MSESAPDAPLAVLEPSQPRRWAGIATSGLLGGLLVVIGVAGEAPLVWQVIFVASGAGVLWSAARMRMATSRNVILTREALATSDGIHIARVDNVRTVERGVFALKPSNGFLVRLEAPEAPAAWAPGLYWRRGTFVGIGGVVSSGQARAMAEILSLLIHDRLPERDN